MGKNLKDEAYKCCWQLGVVAGMASMQKDEAARILWMAAQDAQKIMDEALYDYLKARGDTNEAM